MIPGPGGSLVGAGGPEFPVRSLGSLAWAGRRRLGGLDEETHFTITPPLNYDFFSFLLVAQAGEGFCMHGIRTWSGSGPEVVRNGPEWSGSGRESLLHNWDFSPEAVRKGGPL